MSADEVEAGGFLQASTNTHGLLSPAASTASSSVTSSLLPRPRSQPLRSGSTKESTFINYMDREIMGITRRYAKKFDRSSPGDDDTSPAATTPNEYQTAKHENGYSSFKEVARDVDRLVNVLWVSGSPSLQIPYLLSLASLVATYIPTFTLTPKSMFRVLGKLDYAFASLVTGRDIETGERLPGFEFGARLGLSSTEKVRVKSLVERTRVVVVEAMNRDGEVPGEDDDEDEDEEGGTAGAEDDGDRIDVDDIGDDWGMEVARVYDRTLVEVGDTFGDGEIVMGNAQTS